MYNFCNKEKLLVIANLIEKSGSTLLVKYHSLDEWENEVFRNNFLVIYRDEWTHPTYEFFEFSLC